MLNKGSKGIPKNPTTVFKRSSYYFNIRVMQPLWYTPRYHDMTSHCITKTTLWVIVTSASRHYKNPTSHFYAGHTNAWHWCTIQPIVVPSVAPAIGLCNFYRGCLRASSLRATHANFPRSAHFHCIDLHDTTIDHGTIVLSIYFEVLHVLQ